MKKLIFILFFIVLCFLPTYAKTLKAGISYTVEDARIESFTGISTKIDMNAYSKYLVDENYAENNKAQKRGKTKFRNRTLTVFSSGVYAIKYRSIDKKYFYYDNLGKLKKIDISIGKISICFKFINFCKISSFSLDKIEQVEYTIL